MSIGIIKACLLTDEVVLGTARLNSISAWLDYVKDKLTKKLVNNY